VNLDSGLKGVDLYLYWRTISCGPTELIYSNSRSSIFAFVKFVFESIFKICN